MASAPINEVVNKAFRDAVEKWKNDGLSDEEIIQKIEKVNFEEVMVSVADEASSNFADFFKDKMFEMELDERAMAQEFTARQEQLWGKCFAASQTMYTITIEAAANIAKHIDEDVSVEGKEKRKYTLLSLQHIHGRACQMFLEILTLLRNGFGDCAYARWRSMYELNCIAYFIKCQGEQIAKQYFEQSQSNVPHKDYDWTAGAVNAKGKPIIIKKFVAIETYCKMGQAWNEQYKLACLVTHGTPEGTFKRMSIYETNNIIPVGRSNYGIAMPAEHSAISLYLISAIFFTTIPYTDGIAYAKTLGKWVEVIQDMYYSIENEFFSKK